jgi:DNA-directed RNA polymerase subunit RPC12/RpoP
MTIATPPASAQHQFPCAQCGANLRFEPGTDSLKCPYCAKEQAIPSVPAHIAELDFVAFLNQLPEGDGVGETLTVHCANCGAETGMKPDVTAGLCPFCGCGIVATGASKKTIRPQGLLPFKVSKEQSADLFRKWMNGLWFAPTALKKQADCAAIHGVYVPAWTYDSNTETDYTGERGDDYWETETYTETDAQGNTQTRTRQVQRTRWWPASGQVMNRFDDLLVMATRTLPGKYFDRLEAERRRVFAGCPWPKRPPGTALRMDFQATMPSSCRADRIGGRGSWRRRRRAISGGPSRRRGGNPW